MYRSVQPLNLKRCKMAPYSVSSSQKCAEENNFKQLRHNIVPWRPPVPGIQWVLQPEVWGGPGVRVPGGHRPCPGHSEDKTPLLVVFWSMGETPLGLFSFLFAFVTTHNVGWAMSVKNLLTIDVAILAVHADVAAL